MLIVLDHLLVASASRRQIIIICRRDADATFGTIFGTTAVCSRTRTTRGLKGLWSGNKGRPLEGILRALLVEAGFGLPEGLTPPQLPGVFRLHLPAGAPPPVMVAVLEAGFHHGRRYQLGVLIMD